MSTALEEPTSLFADAVSSALPEEGASRQVDPVIVEQPEKKAAVPPEEPKKEVAPPEPKKEESEQFENPNLRSEEPKKEELKVEDDEKKPDWMTERGFVSWKKTKADAKEANARATAAEKERDDIKAQLSEAGKLSPERDALRKEVEDLKAQLSGYEGEIQVTRVEATKLFKDSVTAPRKEISEASSKIAKRYDIPEETLVKAIQEPDDDKQAEMLDEATTDMKRTDQIRIIELARDYRRTERTADEMRSNAGQKLDEITRQTKEQQDREALEQTGLYQRAASQHWERAISDIPFMRPVPGQDKWNAYLESLKSRAAGININDFPAEEVAAGQISKELLPEVTKTALHFQKQMQVERDGRLSAEKKLADYIATAPGAGKGGNGEGKTTEKTGAFVDAVWSRSEE